jgi:uncharacterized protein with von Willebrand factor type A (vWA) domain
VYFFTLLHKTLLELNSKFARSLKEAWSVEQRAGSKNNQTQKENTEDSKQKGKINHENTKIGKHEKEEGFSRPVAPAARRSFESQRTLR